MPKSFAHSSWRLLTLGIVSLVGCSGGNSDTNATASDPAVPSEIREHLDHKRSSIMGRELVTDLDLDIGLVKRAIKQVEKSQVGSADAFTKADLALIQEGLQERKSFIIDSLVLESLSDQDSEKIKQLAPQALERLQEAKTKRETLDSRKTELVKRIKQLETEAESDDAVKSALAETERVGNVEDEELTQRELQIAMNQASQGARSVDEMIRLQAKAMTDHLEDLSERISAESQERWNAVHVATHRLVWNQLTDSEKQSVGELHLDYVIQTLEQFANFRKSLSKPVAVKEEPKIPTSAELRAAFANQINAEINSHNNLLSRASQGALGGTIDISDIDRDVFAERSAAEHIKLLVDTHGTQLARPLAELCFDPEEDIERQAMKVLKSLGDPAIAELSADGVSAPEAKLFRFAILKTFGKHGETITTAELWDEMLGKTRFADIALRDLSGRRDPIELNPIQMEFTRNGIYSSDKNRCQNCLDIARCAVNLDNQTLDAVEHVSRSGNYLVQSSLEILVKHGRGEKVRQAMIARLAKERTDTGYGFQNSQHDAKELAEQILSLDPQPAELEPLVPRLAEQHEGHVVHESIAKLFAAAGKDSVAPIAVMLSENPSTYQRRELLKALGMIKIASPEVLTVLIRWVRQGDEQERKAAINSLRLMGKEARPVMDQLLVATQDAITGGDAMRAVAAILEDPDEADLRKILPSLRSNNAYVRGEAAEILVNVGPKAKSLLPDVLAISQPSSAASVAQILGSIGETTPEVVTRLVQMTGGRDSFVKQAAIKSLGKLGPGAKSAVPALADIIASQRDNEALYLAIWSLIQINEKTPVVLKALHAIHDKSGPNAYQRFSAVALVHFGEQAELYERDLHYLLENRVSDVGIPFANLAAEQMLHLDPDNRLAKDRLERNRRNQEMDERLKTNSW